MGNCLSDSGGNVSVVDAENNVSNSFRNDSPSSSSSTDHREAEPRSRQHRRSSRSATATATASFRTASGAGLRKTHSRRHDLSEPSDAVTDLHSSPESSSSVSSVAAEESTRSGGRLSRRVSRRPSRNFRTRGDGAPQVMRRGSSLGVERDFQQQYGNLPPSASDSTYSTVPEEMRGTVNPSTYSAVPEEMRINATAAVDKKQAVIDRCYDELPVELGGKGTPRISTSNSSPYGLAPIMLPSVLHSQAADTLIVSAYRPYGRSEADIFLADKPPGTFILRPSNSGGSSTICVSYIETQDPDIGQCKHCLVKHTRKGFTFVRSAGDVLYFDSLRQLLIDHQILDESRLN